MSRKGTVWHSVLGTLMDRVPEGMEDSCQINSHENFELMCIFFFSPSHPKHTYVYVQKVHFYQETKAQIKATNCVKFMRKGQTLFHCSPLESSSQPPQAGRGVHLQPVAPPPS